MCALPLEAGGGAKRTSRQPRPSELSVGEDRPSTYTRQGTAEPAQGAQAAQGTAPGVVSSFTSKSYAPFFGDCEPDSIVSSLNYAPFFGGCEPDSSDDENGSWQHDFTIELDNRLNNLVDAY
jgi:hypothetical protein